MIEINPAEYKQFVTHISKLYKRPGVDIGDATSIAFQALTHAASRFNPDKGKEFKSYAFVVIRHSLWKMKPISPDCEVPIDMELSNEDKEDTSNWEQRKDLLIFALNTIPPREREIIKRSYGIDCESQTYQEIAAVMGISYQRVHQLKSRGMQMLKQVISQAEK